MTKRPMAEFDRTMWDTGVSPVARGKAERCFVCKQGTGGRSFLVDEQVMCERCADKSVTGGEEMGAGTSVAVTMLLGVVTMMVIAIVYVMMHRL